MTHTGKKVNDKWQTFITGFLNKRCALEAAMENLGEEEDEAASVIDAYDFVGFAELERKIQKGEKVVKL